MLIVFYVSPTFIGKFGRSIEKLYFKYQRIQNALRLRKDFRLNNSKFFFTIQSLILRTVRHPIDPFSPRIFACWHANNVAFGTFGVLFFFAPFFFRWPLPFDGHSFPSLLTTMGGTVVPRTFSPAAKSAQYNTKRHSIPPSVFLASSSLSSFWLCLLNALL